MNEDRGPWYLLTGLVIGLVIGLGYAWVFQPVEYVDTTPASLRADLKDRYRALIAVAYLTSGDLVRARARLELLADDDIFAALAGQAQRTLAEGNSPDEARALGMLAIELGQDAPGPAIAVTAVQENQPTALTVTESDTPVSTPTSTPSPSQTPGITSTSTQTPSATIGETSVGNQTESPTVALSAPITGTLTDTPLPRPTQTPTRTPTPTITPGGPFVLVTREEVCSQNLSSPLIQVQVSSISGTPLPGVMVIVNWETGEERFFTGLKPDKGLGYADFIAVPGMVYSLRIGEDGTPASGLQALQCQTAGGIKFWGALLLKFVQT